MTVQAAVQELMEEKQYQTKGLGSGPTMQKRRQGRAERTLIPEEMGKKKPFKKSK